MALFGANHALFWSEMYHMLSYNIVRYCMHFIVSYDIFSYLMVLHGIELYCIVSYGILCYLMVSNSIALYCMLLHCWLRRTGCVLQDAYLLH